ncbi:MAG TPA: HlyD family efflux transporter periplasmic adaptor subunit [Actinocrinis sp.]|nr:HlyD family efflux transporter periplasmic adaptor subunit [Actinocrinis sp.]
MSPRVFSTSRPKLVLNGTLAAVVLVGGGVAYAVVGPANPSSAGTIARQATVATGTVTASITASGNLAPQSTSSLAFGASGQVTAVDVKVGQVVTAGETLATINATQANYNLQLAQDQLTIANDNLSKAQDGPNSVTRNADNASLASQENSLNEAKATLKTAQGLPACPSGQTGQTADCTSTTQLQSDQNAVTNAEDQLNSTEAQQAQSNYVDPSTLAQDQEAVTQAEANVAADQAAVTETTITAPTAGTILTITGQVGSSVSAGTSTTASASGSTSSGSSTGSTGTGSTGTGSTGSSSSSSSTSSSGTFLTMADLSQLQVTADVSETDVASVKTGQAATVTLNALSGATPLQGSVAAVSPTATVVSNVVEYAVTIDVTSALPASVRTGQSASITITTASATNALYVPSSAITTVGGRSIVTVIANGKNTITPVTTGVVGTTDTQILTGLTAGQVVQITLSTATTNGTTGRGFGGIGGGGGAGGAGFGGGGFGGSAAILGTQG